MVLQDMRGVPDLFRSVGGRGGILEKDRSARHTLECVQKAVNKSVTALLR
jgi:hypothetical protein